MQKEKKSNEFGAQTALMRFTDPEKKVNSKLLHERREVVSKPEEKYTVSIDSSLKPLPETRKRKKKT